MIFLVVAFNDCEKRKGRMVTEERTRGKRVLKNGIKLEKETVICGEERDGRDKRGESESVGCFDFINFLSSII